jgi:hypothetical protein
VVDFNAAFKQQFLDVTVEKPVAQIPADRDNENAERAGRTGLRRAARGSDALGVPWSGGLER